VASKKDRQRKLARERMLRQQQRRAEQARRTRQITMISVVCLVVVGLGVGGFFLFSQPGTTSNAAASASASPSSTAATPTPSATPALAKEPAKTCSYPASGTAARKVSKPPTKPDWKATYQATIRTNRGDVVIDLLNSKATCTVNSFVSLADQKYFNKTDCHRLTTVSPLWVLQCGDPTGTGSGGPGYKFNDENLAGAKYTAGTLAMANAGADTNGSQFFIVYKNSTLSPNYTPFGKVVKGLGIIQNVAKAGSNNANGTGDGNPKEKVEIESVTIKKT
jgi:peptidyl-prolyl cis-trans isomerase B (cyclophilin B)